MAEVSHPEKYLISFQEANPRSYPPLMTLPLDVGTVRSLGKNVEHV
jgi:hypothetical protein